MHLEQAEVPVASELHHARHAAAMPDVPPVAGQLEEACSIARHQIGCTTFPCGVLQVDSAQEGMTSSHGAGLVTVHVDWEARFGDGQETEGSALQRVVLLLGPRCRCLIRQRSSDCRVGDHLHVEGLRCLRCQAA